MSSMFLSKYWAILCARIRDALYFPFSREMIVWRVTSTASASSLWVTLRSFLSSCIRFFT